jgi:hypothetical protein
MARTAGKVKMLNHDHLVCFSDEENIACKQGEVRVEYCIVGVLLEAFLHRLRPVQKLLHGAVQEFDTTQVFRVIRVAVIYVLRANDSQRVLATAVQ